MLSWAVPGQGGHHHVNNQPPEYIKERMKEHGLEADEEAEELLKFKATVYWFKNTLMVFRYPHPSDCNYSNS